MQVAQLPALVGVASRHSVTAPGSAVKVMTGLGSAVKVGGDDTIVGGSGGRVSDT